MISSVATLDINAGMAILMLMATFVVNKCFLSPMLEVITNNLAGGWGEEPNSIGKIKISSLLIHV